MVLLSLLLVVGHLQVDLHSTLVLAVVNLAMHYLLVAIHLIVVVAEQEAGKARHSEQASEAKAKHIIIATNNNSYSGP